MKNPIKEWHEGENEYVKNSKALKFTVEKREEREMQTTKLPSNTQTRGEKMIDDEKFVMNFHSVVALFFSLLIFILEQTSWRAKFSIFRVALAPSHFSLFSTLWENCVCFWGKLGGRKKTFLVFFSCCSWIIKFTARGKTLKIHARRDWLGGGSELWIMIIIIISSKVQIHSRTESSFSSDCNEFHAMAPEADWLTMR